MWCQQRLASRIAADNQTEQVALTATNAVKAEGLLVDNFVPKPEGQVPAPTLTAPETLQHLGHSEPIRCCPIADMTWRELLVMGALCNWRAFPRLESERLAISGWSTGTLYAIRLREHD